MPERRQRPYRRLDRAERAAIERGLDKNRLYSSIVLSTFRYDYFRHFAITCLISSTIEHCPTSMPCPSSYSSR